MRAIVHIGMHKTGTTSVKRYCKKNRESLLEAGILYPLSIGDSARNIECKTKDLSGLTNLFASELAQIPDDGTVLVSSETYYNMGDARKEKLIYFLSYFDLEITILCYMRPQVSQVVSYHQQCVIEDFLRDRSLNHTDAVEHFNAEMENGYYQYSRVLDRWAQFVAKEAICVRAYDRGYLFGGSTVKDTAAFVGFDIADTKNTHARTSLSAEKLCFLKTMRMWMDKLKIDLSKESRVKILRHLNSDNIGLPLDISSNDKSYIAERCMADNKRLAKNYLEPIHADLFLNQDINSVNGKTLEDVNFNDVAGIYHHLNDEVPILKSYEMHFLEYLESIQKMIHRSSSSLSPTYCEQNL